MNALLALALLLAIPRPATAQPATCALERGEKITVACTKACDQWVQRAFQEVAKKLGLQLAFVTLITTPDAKYDAIFSPGGADIGPEYYTRELPPEMRQRIEKEYERTGSTGPVSKKRDRFEYDLFRKYFQDESFANIPALGVCYGMQMMSVAHGLPLYVDIPTDLGIPARRNLADTVTFLESDKSALQPYFAKTKFAGRESHHQAVDLAYYRAHRDQFAGTTVVATSNDDRIAEAIEFEGRPAAGVQFHPEISGDTAKFGTLSWFLTAACVYKKLRNREPATAAAAPAKQCN